jgi:hypothetical protein
MVAQLWTILDAESRVEHTYPVKATYTPSVTPAKSLTFCGLSLSVDVSPPALFSSLSKNSTVIH